MVVHTQLDLIQQLQDIHAMAVLPGNQVFVDRAGDHH